MSTGGNALLDGSDSKILLSQSRTATELGALLASNNLSDVGTLATAQSNLGVNVHATRITKTFSDFATAGLTNTVNLITLPAKSIVRDVKLVVTAPGDVVTTLTISVGPTGNLIKYVAASSGLAAASTIYPVALTVSDLLLSSTTIQAQAISTISNLNAMTQGSWDFYILYENY